MAPIRTASWCAAAALFAIGLASPTHAQQPIIYPSEGQTPEQQAQDDVECQAWATQNTGVDPVAIAQAPAPQSSGSSAGGNAVRGGLGGAALGAIGGAIGGDVGKGAAIGAGVGAAGGLFNHMGNSQRDQQRQQQDSANRQNAMAEWNRARGACMTGRGYTVS